MREALARGDNDATERIAHTLKGELGYLAASEASHNACELEDAARNGDLACAARIQILLERDIENIVNAMRGVVAPIPTGLSLANQQPDPRERIDSVGDERAVLLGAPDSAAVLGTSRLGCRRRSDVSPHPAELA